MGDRERPDYVLLHGLPIDSDAWADVTAELGLATLRADLPGLGRSAPLRKPMAEWLEDLMLPVTTRPVLVAHWATSAAPSPPATRTHRPWV